MVLLDEGLPLVGGDGGGVFFAVVVGDDVAGDGVEEGEWFRWDGSSLPMVESA